MRRLVVLSLCAVSAACGGDLGRHARTSVTSGDPNPAAAPRTSRTIDNTGFVDNGGRTSDQHSRPQTSGARATEGGGNPPTGTNTGIPVGADLGGNVPAPLPTPERAAVMPRGGGSPIAGDDATTGRLARAVCDHETTCTRVGEGRTWQSQAACMSDVRARANAELRELGCAFDRAAVAGCLAAVRTQPCTSTFERLDRVSACSGNALCTP